MTPTDPIKRLASEIIIYFVMVDDPLRKKFLDHIESLLSEAMAAEYLRGIQKTLCCCEPRGEDCNCAEDARNSALEDAAKVALDYYEWQDPNSIVGCAMQISERIRALRTDGGKCECGSPLNHVRGCPAYVSYGDKKGDGV